MTEDGVKAGQGKRDEQASYSAAACFWALVGLVLIGGALWLNA
jgi:hypothetical protein